MTISIKSLTAIRIQLNHYENQVHGSFSFEREAILSIVMKGLVAIDGVGFYAAVEMVNTVLRNGEDECWEVLNRSERQANPRS